MGWDWEGFVASMKNMVRFTQCVHESHSVNWIIVGG